MVRKFSLPHAPGYGLRLHRIGCASRPFYLIGAMPRCTPAGKQYDRRPDEVIGSVDPMPNDRGEIVIGCDMNRLCYYVGKGAVPSGGLADYLALAGVWPMPVKMLINSMRKRQGLEVRGGVMQFETAADKQAEQAAASAAAGQTQAHASNQSQPNTAPTSSNQDTKPTTAM